MDQNFLQDSTYYTYNNIKMRYWIVGEGNPILFLHGGGANYYCVKKFIDKLSKKNTVIVVDLPGHGFSSCPKEVWGVEEYAKYTSKFIDTLEFENIIVIGHSLGGGIAIKMREYSTRLSKVKVINSIGIKHEDFNKVLLNLFIWDPVVGVIKYSMLKYYWQYFLGFILNLFLQFANLRQSYKIVKKCVKSGIKEINSNITPVNIMWGRGDKIFSVQNANKLNDMIPNSKLTFVEGNHNWFLLDSNFDKIMED